MAKKAFKVTAAIVLALLIVKPQMYALELEITGNGDGSSSEVEVKVEQETNVEQTNESSVENTVEEEANTGENQANENTGGQTQIETGDIEATTTVTNDLNTSVVDYENCCPEETTIVIEGNGANSQNSAELTLINQTNVSVHQEAKVVNRIEGTANTGRNTASSNGGSVSIDTGNITAQVNIKNAANHAAIQVSAAGSPALSVRIANNGSDSVNIVKLNLTNSTTVDKHDLADIDNIIVWDANTGENEANNNLGDVAITTGDIVLGINIQNGPINDSWVFVGGCCQPSDPADPGDPGDPGIPPSTQPPTGGSNQDGGSSTGSGDGGNSGGDDAGQVLGAILPATGSLWWLLALLANIATFLMGTYLRLRSGRSPSKVA